ncbi:hypothetical protein ACIGB8_28765 [Promicromonospora sukumoe]|uniref:hypothetical protein n=1 Tax=Promicromonospora sukumoe TaxID=88382 RepID=UPI0037CA1DD3
MSENENLPLPSVDGMLREMRGLGISVAEMARMLDRSPRLVRAVISGEKKGENLRAAVTELHQRGTVSTPPPRRRGADGHVVPVRAHGGGTTAPTGPSSPRAPRGKFTEQITVLAGGTRMVEVTAPKTRGTKGREQANEHIVGALRRGAQGQRWSTKKVKFQVTTSDGRTFPVGQKSGYQVSSVLGRATSKKRRPTPTEKELSRLGEAAAKATIQAAAAFAGDAMGWLKSQAQHRYVGMDKAGTTITGVTMVIYDDKPR